jgi:glucose-1-phosphate thymidylyltransferase
MKCNKGIILAGGTGSRLYPLTRAVNKQLLPIFDKPTIYYPLTTLMLADIREILIISTPSDVEAIQNLLGNGSQFGLDLRYEIQDRPRGLPEAFIIGKDFAEGQPVAMILGDNLFYGQGFSGMLAAVARDIRKSHVFLYSVKDPSRYGVAKFDNDDRLEDVIEKPKDFVSSWAVTGLYFFPGDVSERAAALKPSARGEFEITDLIRSYIGRDGIDSHRLSRGNVWFDVGTPEALLQASIFVEVLQNRQNLLIASPEEIAWRMNFIKPDDYKKIISALPNCSYRAALEMTLVA